MFSTLSRIQILSSKLSTVYTRAPITLASFHTYSTVYEAHKESPIHENTALYALKARLGLYDLDNAVFQQALTHPSFTEENNNTKFEYVGKRVVGLLATEYFHCKYPAMPTDIFAATIGGFIGNKSTSKIAVEVGLQYSVNWNRPADADVKLGQSTVLASCMNAIVGAIYQDKGLDAAKKFVHDFILSREVDLQPLLKVKEPKRTLSALLRKMGKEEAVSRLVSETGRASSSPVFVVGVFSGTEKLGEGFGSSLKMAEFRACQDALTKHFGREEKNFTLPSDADKVDNYLAKPLADTAPII
ncbi:ribonuclease III domain-containing protein [Pilobolus umbonatus]|nr:ribonuclease III domain-containing protein [Pilobolus umbonatus]